jgi:hypothetical protein
MRAKDYTKILIWFPVLIFVLSLGLHNHVFYFGSSLPEGVYKTDSAYPGHSIEYCSACRLSGNLRQTDNFVNVGFGKFGQLLAYVNNEVLIPLSYCRFNYSPRSPPTT